MNIWIIIIFMVVWLGLNMFLMNRQQKKQAEEREKMFADLQRGDEVVMASGLHGLIDELNEEEGYVVLDCEGIFLTFDLQSLRGRATNQLLPGPEPLSPQRVTEGEEAVKLEENVDHPAEKAQSEDGDDL